MSKSVLDCVPSLLLPNRKSYPFDITATKIVRALGKRNWKVPGIEVQFTTYGTGFGKYSFVRKIIGYTIQPGGRTDDFILEFEASPEKSSICQIIFKEERLEVYSDDSGPTYWLYVGPGSLHYPPDSNELQTEIDSSKSWKYTTNDGFFAKMPDEATARSTFMHSSTLCHARLDSKPRIALYYINEGYRAALNKGAQIVNSDDLERSYKALPSEPQSFDLDKLYNHFAKRLKKILAKIEQCTIEETFDPLAYFKEEAKIPIKNIEHPLKDVYAIISSKSFERIEDAKQNGTDNIEPRDFYALLGCQCGSLLVPIEEALSEPKYRYCENIIDIPFYTGVFDQSFGWGIARINLKYANGCFVTDGAAYMSAREAMFKQIAPRQRLNDAEVRKIEEVDRKKRVPLIDYDGSYQKPYLIIERELDFDEVELIGKYRPTPK